MRRASACLRRSLTRYFQIPMASRAEPTTTGTIPETPCATPVYSSLRRVAVPPNPIIAAPPSTSVPPKIDRRTGPPVLWVRVIGRKRSESNVCVIGLVDAGPVSGGACSRRWRRCVWRSRSNLNSSNMDLLDPNDLTAGQSHCDVISRHVLDHLPADDPTVIEVHGRPLLCESKRWRDADSDSPNENQAKGQSHATPHLRMIITLEAQSTRAPQPPCLNGNPGAGVESPCYRSGSTR